MEPRVTLEELREVFLSAEESQAARFVAIAVSLALAGVILWLVRRRALREEYTPIWLAVAAGLLAVSLRFDWLKALTRAIGAWTPSSTLFFLGEVFLVAICLNFAVRLSRASVQLKNLGQEVAILNARIDALTAADAPPGEQRSS
ncbi:MAG: DUF2304 domain-containing protein [Proteobacteria bacterium]|nr:MAG: DUF2304 domain-containing protein [Pseudomonadota bacterium]